MTEVHIENLVSADDDHSENDDGVNVDPDLPPESFWLSKDAERDWFDRTAFHYHRNDSTIPKTLPPNSNSNSHRSSKSKPAIFGLPKTHKTTYVDSKRRSCIVKMLPKTVSMAEPGSPKVSCMGKVRSKRCRRRSNSLKRKEKPVDRSRSGAGEKQRTGFYSKFMSMFAKKGRKKPSRSGSRNAAVVAEEPPVERRRDSVSSKGKEIPVCGDPPGLGGVKRFTSGRRSGSWTGDDFNQAVAGQLDSDWRVRRS